MSTYDVRSSQEDATYGVFDTLEAAERALSMVQRRDPDAQIIVKRDWRDRAFDAEAEVETLRAQVQAVLKLADAWAHYSAQPVNAWLVASLVYEALEVTP